jgi:hypothetical protein
MGSKLVKKCCCDAITGEDQDSFDSGGPAEIPLHRKIQMAGFKARERERIKIVTKSIPFDEEAESEWQAKCKWTLVTTADTEWKKTAPLSLSTYVANLRKR